MTQNAKLVSLKAAVDQSRLDLTGLTIGTRGEIIDKAGRPFKNLVTSA